MSIKGEKRGQLTIFIIVAILIVALALFIYFFYPKLRPVGVETDNPYSYIEKCMKDTLEETVEVISMNGGNYEVNENNGFFYRGDYVKYLCYTNENFIRCVNQEPFLTEHVEEEILTQITPEIDSCFEALVETYERKGYDVDLTREITKVEILPDRVSTNFHSKLNLVKGSESQNYEKFEIDINSNLYEMLEVVKNIVTWEINVGDSISEAYMLNNPNIKVEKKRKENDVKLYIITDRTTEEVFRFAIRSFAYPVGFI